ncbi:hypothetical protein [Streptomyces fructofermentans]|uniref:hypothetical protein n=1 Tax=Streptomyces fructofermentans TaxID=152141 RepID=UPI00379CE192
MTTRFDEGPEFEPDDPLAVILRPPSDYLGPPPGRYEAIRRAAVRRRVLRVAVGAGLTCAAAFLVALPLQVTTPEAPVSPTVPLAPPPPTVGTTDPTPSGPPSALPTPRPTRDPVPVPSAPRSGRLVPTRAPSATPVLPRAAGSERSSGAEGSRDGAAPEDGGRP